MNNNNGINEQKQGFRAEILITSGYILYVSAQMQRKYSGAQNKMGVLQCQHAFMFCINQ